MGDILNNPKARRDYHILDTVEAGIVLRGTEVKSLRAGKGQLTDAFARVERGEAWLYNVHIEEYAFGNILNHEPKSRRKLLLHRHELRHLHDKAQIKGHSLIPLSMYWKNGHVKVLIAVAKGKAQTDKRDDIRKRESDREMKRVMMHRSKGRS